MCRLEKRFRRLRTLTSHAEWRQQSDNVRDVYQEAYRASGFSGLKNWQTQKVMVGQLQWAAANRLLQPSTSAYSSLRAEDFAAFFQQKIADIRQKTAAAPAPR